MAAGFFGVATGRRGAGFAFAAPLPVAFGLALPFALAAPFALARLFSVALAGELAPDELAGGFVPGRFDAPDLPAAPDVPWRPRALEDVEAPGAGGRAAVFVRAGVLVVDAGAVTVGAGASCSAWFGSVMPTAL